MQLVEQHLIGRSDPRFAAIDQAAFASKNLYNIEVVYQKSEEQSTVPLRRAPGCSPGLH